MNPNQCRVALRPRGPLEVFDLAFRFMRVRIRPLSRLMALTVLPVWVVLSVAAWLTDGHVAVAVAAIGLGIALRGLFTVLAGRLLFAEDVSVVPLTWETLKQVQAGASIALLAGAGWLAAALTCFVGLPWVQGGLLYLPEIALLEKVGPGRAYRRAYHLATGHPGNAIVGVLAAWVLTVWFGLMGEMVGHAVVGFVFQLGEPFGSLWRSGQVTPYLVGGLLLAQPLFAVFRLLLYVDVRTRVEGWDLQVGLRAAGLVR